MSIRTGNFVWYELLTSDPAAAAEFYTKVVGWTCADAGTPDGDYSLFSVGDSRIAGLMAMPAFAAANGAPVGWRGFIAVNDVDADAARVKTAGGSLHYGPEDIPGVGRFASVTDPQGAPFVLFAPVPGDNPLLAPGTAGTVGWHELHAADYAQALEFYAGMFGWMKADAVDMGPMGTYQMFSARDGVALGGMMNRQDAPSPSRWLYYVNVPDIRAAEARITQAGGTVPVPPHQVPGGSWILHGKDPQGGDFALVSPPG